MNIGVNKQMINFILSEQDKLAEYQEVYATHSPGKGRVIAKLLYYQPSVWEPMPEEEKKVKSRLILGANTDNVFDASKDKKVTQADDGVIPFVLILDSGDCEDVSTGSIHQVSRSRVTGETENPAFLAMADLIRKNKPQEDGKSVVEQMNTPEAKLASLVRFWGNFQLEAPWLKIESLTDFFVYELPTPELKGMVHRTKLQNLV